MKINDLALVENINILYENKVVLYGAGGGGIGIYVKLKEFNTPVAYFCDSDTKKHGIAIDGVKIISPDELKAIDEKESIVIIISVIEKSLAEEILKIINNLELRTENVFTAFALEISIMNNLSSINMKPEFRQLLYKTGEFVFDCIAQNLSNAYYSLLEFVYNLDSVLVYQPGKVGSVAMFVSLTNAGIVSFHIHRIPVTKMNSLDNDIHSALMNYINSKERIKIITLVREPIARELSAYFYNMTNRYHDTKGYSVMNLGESFLDSCVRFIKNLTFTNSIYGALFDWFDQELKKVFGIDVFEYPFDREKGYTIIKQGNVEILLMKLEKLSNLEGVIGEFVGATDFKLQKANEGDKKISRFLYAGVKEKIKIPREVFDFYYENNPRMDHFYSEEEKRAFLKKWEKNIGD